MTSPGIVPVTSIEILRWVMTIQMCLSAEDRHELDTRAYEKLVAGKESGAPRIASSSAERVGGINGYGGQDNLSGLF
jgi:hypothetical protein